jgi:hypothetical protein
MNSKFIEIDGNLVNKEILEVKFTCDLNSCKGACCTLESDYGAPITKEELDIIEKNLDIIFDYIPEYSKALIKAEGFWDIEDDLIMTKSINNEDCVFVYYEGDVAKCGIEKAYFDNKIDFRKPISCHLFPIRVNNFGQDILKFERYTECRQALLNGIQTDISIAEFCKDALIRLYGKKWYDKLINGRGK